MNDFPVNRVKYVADVSVSNVDKLSLENQKRVHLCNYVDVYKNDRITNDINFMDATATDEQIKKFSLIKNDVLITKDSESPEDIAVPAIVVDNIPNLVCGYHLALYRPRKCNGAFLKYSIQSKKIRDYFAISATGITRFGLSIDEIASTPIPNPSLVEQESIASFLDKETSEIDALISAKEHMLSLLAEKRKALITHAVTRGLNSDVPTKDSGVPWLDKVPEHWSTPPIYARYEVKLGKMLDEKKISKRFLAHYLRNVDVQWESINYENLPQMDFDEDDQKSYSLKRGDILVCEGGEVGRCAIFNSDATGIFYQKALHRLRPKTSNDLPHFIVFVMRAMVDIGVFTSDAVAATIQHLPAEKLRVLRYPSPPFKEQEEIVAHVKKQTSKIDALRAATEKSIRLLKERRAALISAAVTGQIRV